MKFASISSSKQELCVFWLYFWQRSRDLVYFCQIHRLVNRSKKRWNAPSLIRFDLILVSNLTGFWVFVCIFRYFVSHGLFQLETTSDICYFASDCSLFWAQEVKNDQFLEFNCAWPCYLYSRRCSWFGCFCNMYSAPQSINEVCALSIKCKLLAFTLENPARNEQTINSIS